LDNLFVDCVLGDHFQEIRSLIFFGWPLLSHEREDKLNTQALDVRAGFW
jgi:hypothetical protein